MSNINLLLVRAFYDLALGCRGDVSSPLGTERPPPQFFAPPALMRGQLIAGVGHEVLVATLFERPVRTCIKNACY
jgi:hypothetical protein